MLILYRIFKMPEILSSIQEEVDFFFFAQKIWKCILEIPNRFFVVVNKWFSNLNSQLSDTFEKSILSLDS